MTSDIPTKHQYRIELRLRDEFSYDNVVYYVDASTRAEAVRKARAEARREGYEPIRTADVQMYDGHARRSS